MTTATCDHCGLARPIRDDGRIAPHKIQRRVMKGGAWREQKRRCPGSGQRPRYRPGVES